MISKTFFYYLLFLCFSFLCIKLNAQNRNVSQINYIPDELKNYVSSLQSKVDYADISDFSFVVPPAYIDKAKAIEDIKTLRYILETGYCGRFYWGENGVDFNDLYLNLSEFVESSTDSVSVRSFENIIINSLSKLNDGHSKLEGFKVTEFAKSKHAYFADIVLEKQNNTYRVIQSNQPDIKSGMIYSGSIENLFLTLSPENKEHYLLGMLSFSKVENLKLFFDGKVRIVKLHRCKISTAINSDKVFESEQKGDITYVRVSKLDERYQNTLKKFVAIGSELKNKKFIVYNLVNVDGGNAIYPRLFIENLNTNARGFDYMAVLHSPSVNQAYMPGKNLWMSIFLPKEWLVADVEIEKLPSDIAQIISELRDENEKLRANPSINWEIVKNEIPETGSFKGRFITIINSKVGSAAINATAFTKSIPNNIIVGENTSGGFTFGEVVYYCLGNSKLKLKIPTKIVITKDFNYEQGFLPDYWLDSNDPETEITRWLNNSDTYQFIY
jgi:hypothetical protein